MATSTVALISNALKDIYLDPLIKQLDEENGPLYAAIEKKNETLQGGKFVFAMQYGRSGGIGARDELGALPTPNPRSVIQGQLAPKNIYARMALSEKLMLTAVGGQSAFIDAFNSQMEDLVTDCKDYTRRMLIGGTGGIMGTTGAASSASTTVTLAATTNVRKFYPGQIIDIFTVSGSTVTKAVDAGTIVDVDYANSTLKMAAAVTCGSGDYISIAGAYNCELTGLEEIFNSNSTIYGINRANYKWFNPKAYDKSSSGTPSTFNSMWIQEAIDEVEDSLGSHPDFLVCDAGVQRAYIQEQNTYKRNLEYRKIDGGVDVLQFNGRDIVKEKYMPKGTIYILDTNDFKMLQLQDWSWMEADGSVLARMADKAAYEATLTRYCDLMCNKIGAQSEISGIAEV